MSDLKFCPFCKHNAFLHAHAQEVFIGNPDHKYLATMETGKFGKDDWMLDSKTQCSCTAVIKDGEWVNQVK